MGGSPPESLEAERELAQTVVAEALRRGADAAECVVREGRELAVTVRLGEVESLKQAQSKSLGIRVFRDGRAGVTHSSDFGRAAIGAMIASALAIAAATSQDPQAGMPAEDELGEAPGDLELYSPAAAAVTPEEAIAWALRGEAAARGFDPRIVNSDGASFEAGEGSRALANSHGFCGAYRRSSCSGSVVPIAALGERKQRDSWYTLARDASGLETPEAVGRRAAERALRRLGARKPATARLPVVFDPQTARSLLGHLAEAAGGDAVYRESSFLRGRQGEIVAAPGLTVWDDGTRPGGWGSAPFDGEGAPTRRKAVIRDGRLETFLLNCYAGRKLGLATTGNASRALAGTPGIAAGNFWLEPGAATPAELIAGVKRGLYVTELIGFGFNPVSGDYSRGASGLWIENGELTHPVEEVTIAGNFQEMLRHIAAVANDLEFRGAMAAPTLVVEGMTIAGAQG